MLRLLTNIPALREHAGSNISVTFEQRWRLKDQWKCRFAAVRQALRHDGVLLSTPGPDALLLSILVKLLSRGAVRFYFYDILLTPRTTGWRAALKDAIRRKAAYLAERVFLVHLDLETYARALRLDPARLQWIGFKCNNYERLGPTGPQPATGGRYVLACGQSYRDYPTFIAAVSRLSIPAVIVLPPRTDLSVHGSWLGDAPLPANIAVFEHDGRTQSWDAYLRGAKLVVVPLRHDTVQPAGISVCLEAMAFGKAVIVSEGPLTRGGLFAPPAAETVPANDPAALARTIQTLWNDDALRNERASAGAALARRLGGVRRMAEDLLAAIATDMRAEIQSPLVPRREKQT